MEEPMKVDSKLIKTLREERAWSQEHLASVTGLSLRTIQRVESEGVASLETRMALAGAFNLAAAALAPAVPTASRDQARARHAVIFNSLLWAAAIIASALVTKSTMLSVVLLPGFASASLVLMNRSNKRRACALASKP